VITLQRGLCQRDLLSPYPFLFCAEGFPSLMCHAEEWNDIEGIQICRGAPSVSHLVFVDDSLILMKATNHNAAFLRDLIEVYEVCSFQQINKKPSILFSKNTKISVRGNI
jgi:hypothetical protein